MNTRIDTESHWKLLAEHLLQHICNNPGSHSSGIAGVEFHCHVNDAKPTFHFLQPSILVVVQGKKVVYMRRKTCVYGERSVFVTGIDMPVTSGTVDASKSQPYLAISITLNMSWIKDMLLELAPLTENYKLTQGSIVMHEVDAALLESLLRLVEACETPEKNEILLYLTLKDIHYKILTGPCGSILRALSLPGTQMARIASVITALKANLLKEPNLNKMAARFHMAPATLYKYFTDVTTTNPQKYLKNLRLVEARRILQTGEKTVFETALLVGYNSSKPFIEDYKQLFGKRPHKKTQKEKSDGSVH